MEIRVGTKLKLAVWLLKSTGSFYLHDIGIRHVYTLPP